MLKPDFLDCFALKEALRNHRKHGHRFRWTRSSKLWKTSTSHHEPPTPYLECSQFAMVKHVQTSSVIMTNQSRCARVPHKTTWQVCQSGAKNISKGKPYSWGYVFTISQIVPWCFRAPLQSLQGFSFSQGAHRSSGFQLWNATGTSLWGVSWGIGTSK